MYTNYNKLLYKTQLNDISDGETTSFGEFPWMTAILRIQPDNNVFVCGASIIHPSVILTAAHCVR